MAETLFYASVYRRLRCVCEAKTPPINLDVNARATLQVDEYNAEIDRVLTLLKSAQVTFDLQKRYQGSIPDEDFNLTFNADGLIPLNPDCLYVVAAMAGFFCTTSIESHSKLTTMFKQIEGLQSSAERIIASDENDNTIELAKKINEYSRNVTSAIDGYYAILNSDDFDTVQIVNVATVFDFPVSDPDPISKLKSKRLAFSEKLTRYKLHINTYLVSSAKEFVDYFLNFAKVKQGANLTAKQFCLHQLAIALDKLLNTSFQLTDKIRNFFYSRVEIPRYLNHSNFLTTLQTLIDIELNNQLFDLFTRSYHSASEHIGRAKTTTYRIKKWWNLSENITYELFTDQMDDFLNIFCVYQKVKSKIKKYFNNNVFVNQYRAMDLYYRSGIMKYFVMEPNIGVTGSGKKFKCISKLPINDFNDDEKLICDILFNTVDNNGIYGKYDTSKDYYTLHPAIDTSSSRSYHNRCRFFVITELVASIIRRYYTKISKKDVLCGCRFYYEAYKNANSISSVVRNRWFDVKCRILNVIADSHDVQYTVDTVTNTDPKDESETKSGDRLFSVKNPKTTTKMGNKVIRCVIATDVNGNKITHLNGRFKEGNDIVNGINPVANDTFVNETITLKNYQTYNGTDCSFFGNFNDIAEFYFRSAYYCVVDIIREETELTTRLFHFGESRTKDKFYRCVSAYLDPSDSLTDVVTFGRTTKFVQSQSNTTSTKYNITFDENVDEFGDRCYNGNIMYLLYTIDASNEATDLNLVAKERVGQLDGKYIGDAYIGTYTPAIHIKREYPLIESQLLNSKLVVYDSLRDTIFLPSCFDDKYLPQDFSFGSKYELHDGFRLQIRSGNYALPVGAIIPPTIDLVFKVDKNYVNLQTIQSRNYDTFKMDPVDGVIPTQYNRDTSELTLKLPTSKTLALVDFKRPVYRLNDDCKLGLFDRGLAILNVNFSSPEVYIEVNGKIVKYRDVCESPLTCESFLGLQNTIPGRLFNVIANGMVSLYQVCNNRSYVGNVNLVETDLAINIIARSFKRLSEMVPANATLRLEGFNTIHCFKDLYDSCKQFINSFLIEQPQSIFNNTLQLWNDVIECIDRDKVNKPKFFETWACCPITKISDSVEKIDYIAKGGILLPACSLINGMRTIQKKWLEWFDSSYVDYLINLFKRYIEYCILSGTPTYYTPDASTNSFITKLYQDPVIKQNDESKNELVVETMDDIKQEVAELERRALNSTLNNQVSTVDNNVTKSVGTIDQNNVDNVQGNRSEQNERQNNQQQDQNKQQDQDDQQDQGEQDQNDQQDKSEQENQNNKTQGNQLEQNEQQNNQNQNQNVQQDPSTQQSQSTQNNQNEQQGNEQQQNEQLSGKQIQTTENSGADNNQNNKNKDKNKKDNKKTKE